MPLPHMFFNGRLFVPQPTFSVVRSVTTLNEGSSITFTINTTNVSDGTTLYYSISGTGITAGDFTDSTLTGSFTINNDTGSVTKTATEDAATEGNETFTFNVREDSVSGTIVGTTTAEIIDTSTAIAFTTDSTYGTLVASFAGAWNTGSYTEGIPTLSDSNVILSDSNFQTVRSNTTSNLVYYVWGSSQEHFWSFSRTQIESANVRAAPTTTINPNNFGAGLSDLTPMHWWDENTGATLSGSDYSFVSYNVNGGIAIFDLSTLKAAGKSSSRNIIYVNRESTPKVWVFYK